MFKQPISGSSLTITYTRGKDVSDVSGDNKRGCTSEAATNKELSKSK